MSIVQSYNPVKIRVRLEDGSLGSLDGNDAVYATADDARAALLAGFEEDGDAPYRLGEPLGRRDRYVIVPAWVQ